MSLMNEVIGNILSYAEYKYNAKKEELRKELEVKGLKAYFVHELTSCKKKYEFRQAYPKLEIELMRKPSLMLGEIVQRGVKAYLPKDIKEERVFYKVLGNLAIIGTPDFYSESRRSVYELKFTNGKPKVLDHHRLRASLYKWLSNTEHSYLLYCSPKGFREFEVNDNFNEDNIKFLMDNWRSPMWDWECRLCVYGNVCLNKIFSKSKNIPHHNSYV